jgi:hypothetical protein
LCVVGVLRRPCRPGRRAAIPRRESAGAGLAGALRLRAHGPGDGRELTLVTTLTRCDTAVDVTLAELRLEAFPPADETTSAMLAESVER